MNDFPQYFRAYITYTVAADWWKPGRSRRTLNHNNGSRDKMDNKQQCAQTWSAYTSSSAVPGPQNHLLCCFSQHHVQSSGEVNVLFSAMKLLCFLFKKKERKSFLFQVYRSAGSKISLKLLFRIPLSLPQTFGKTYMNYRPGNDLFMYLILFLKENIYLRLWLPCSSQGTWTSPLYKLRQIQ